MSMKLNILTYFRNHENELFSVKELCKEFDITQPAMWKNIRELWAQNWITKDTTTIPAKYKFNELFKAL